MSGKVIHLTQSLRFLSHCKLPVLYYLTVQGEWTEFFASLGSLVTVQVRGVDELHSRLMVQRPNLILIESNLTWMDSLTAMQLLGPMTRVPMILLCNRSQKPLHSNFIKRAYRAGAYDIFCSPIQQEELAEAVTLLLRMERNSSSL